MCTFIWIWNVCNIPKWLSFVANIANHSLDNESLKSSEIHLFHGLFCLQVLWIKTQNLKLFVSKKASVYKIGRNIFIKLSWKQDYYQFCLCGGGSKNLDYLVWQLKHLRNAFVQFCFPVLISGHQCTMSLATTLLWQAPECWFLSSFFPPLSSFTFLEISVCVFCVEPNLPLPESV